MISISQLTQILSAIAALFFFYTGPIWITLEHGLMDRDYGFITIGCIFVGILQLLCAIILHVKQNSIFPSISSASMIALISILLIVFSSTYLLFFTQASSETLRDMWYQAKPSTIELIEHDHQCCGFSTVHDHSIPEHCSTDQQFGYQLPCESFLRNDIYNKQGWLCAVAEGVGITQLVFSTFLLVDLMRKKKSMMESNSELESGNNWLSTPRVLSSPSPSRLLPQNTQPRYYLESSNNCTQTCE